jgi:hypothetical protein
VGTGAEVAGETAGGCAGAVRLGFRGVACASSVRSVNAIARSFDTGSDPPICGAAGATGIPRAASAASRIHASISKPASNVASTRRMELLLNIFAPHWFGHLSGVRGPLAHLQLTFPEVTVKLSFGPCGTEPENVSFTVPLTVNPFVIDG